MLESSGCCADVPGLHLLPNPATFKVDGVTFGAVTSDVIKHLSGAEVKLGAAPADRISCLVAHLLAQQRCAWGSTGPCYQ